MKKINSQVNFSYDQLKCAIGTVDKKNPSTFYLELLLNIMPEEKKDSYENDVFMVKKELYNNIDTMINKINNSGNNVSLDKNYILNFEIATDRIMPKKRSYLTCQIYLKQRNNNSFNSIIDFSKEFIPILSVNLIGSLQDYGFKALSFKKK